MESRPANSFPFPYRTKMNQVSLHWICKKTMWQKSRLLGVYQPLSAWNFGARGRKIPCDLLSGCLEAKAVGPHQEHHPAAPFSLRSPSWVGRLRGCTWVGRYLHCKRKNPPFQAKPNIGRVLFTWKSLASSTPSHVLCVRVAVAPTSDFEECLLASPNKTIY